MQKTKLTKSGLDVEKLVKTTVSLVHDKKILVDHLNSEKSTTDKDKSVTNVWSKIAFAYFGELPDIKQCRNIFDWWTRDTRSYKTIVNQVYFLLNIVIYLCHGAPAKLRLAP
jgi:hypothetical protein